MDKILPEEKGHYAINCENALWWSGEIHSLYHECGTSLLCDADFVLETDQFLLLIEYKNANVPEARAHAGSTEEFDPKDQKKLDKIARKYYDSLHYLHLKGKNKPVRYIYVVEYPKGDEVSRKMLRNRLKNSLPFELQKRVNSGIKLIHSVDVMNIAEWNADAFYGQYPFVELK